MRECANFYSVHHVCCAQLSAAILSPRSTPLTETVYFQSHPIISILVSILVIIAFSCPSYCLVICIISIDWVIFDVLVRTDYCTSFLCLQGISSSTHFSSHPTFTLIITDFCLSSMANAHLHHLYWLGVCQSPHHHHHCLASAHQQLIAFLHIICSSNLIIIDDWCHHSINFAQLLLWSYAYVL